MIRVCWLISLEDIKAESIKGMDAGLTVCICFIPTVSARLSGPVASASYTGTKLHKPSACSEHLMKPTLFS